jgi:hypothetical protein
MGSDDEMKTTIGGKVSIQQVDNGFILRFKKQSGLSVLKEDYDYEPQRVEVYAEMSDVFKRLVELMPGKDAS